MPETIEVTNWTNYLKEFSEKNLKRLVRLEIFGELGALEEVKKLPLAGVYVEMDGGDAPRAEILLGGLSANEVDYLTHTVPQLKTIMTLRGADELESAIEFESADGTKTLLSFEATVAETQTA